MQLFIDSLGSGCPVSVKFATLKLLKRQDVINMLNKINSTDEKIYMMMVLNGILIKQN